MGGGDNVETIIPKGEELGLQLSRRKEEKLSFVAGAHEVANVGKSELKVMAGGTDMPLLLREKKRLSMAKVVADS